MIGAAPAGEKNKKLKKSWMQEGHLGGPRRTRLRALSVSLALLLRVLAADAPRPRHRAARAVRLRRRWRVLHM